MTQQKRKDFPQWIAIFLPVIRKIQNVAQYVIKEKWIHWIYWVGLLAVCLVYLLRDYRSISQATFSLKINFWFILLSLLVMLIVEFFIGTTSWWAILMGLGQKMRWFDAARIQLVSTLPKYLPGSAWQYVVKSYLLSESKTPPAVMGISFFIEMGQNIWIGIGISLLTYNRRVLPTQFFQVHNVFALGIGSLVILIAAVLPWVLPEILKRFNLPKLEFYPQYLFMSFVFVIFGWLALGLVVWLIGLAITYNPLYDFRLTVFAISTSLIAGLLALFAPNGLGVREGVMVLILGRVLSTPLSLVIALTSRLLFTFSEITSAVFIESLFRWRNHHRSLENTS